MEPSDRPPIITFGDSLTQYGNNPELCGWVAGLAHWYARRADVVNRGYSGYNTRWCRPVLDKMLAVPQQPILVTILFGANDAAQPASHLQHVPLEEYKANLLNIVQYTQKRYSSAKILLITPPPLDEAKHLQTTIHRMGNEGQVPTTPDRTNENTSCYAAAVRSLGEELGVPVVDLWKDPFKIISEDLEDGLHFAQGGNTKLCAAIKTAVREHYPELVPENEDRSPGALQLHFPHWRDVDSENPGSSLCSWTWQTSAY